MREWNLIPGARWHDHTVPEHAIYVDSEYGNDTTGEGTMEKPYRTINRARSGQESEYIICRGYFRETIDSFSPRAFLLADTLHGAVYDGNLTQTDSDQFLHFLDWLCYYNSRYYGNMRIYSYDSGFFINKEEGAAFAIRIVEEAANVYRKMGSFYRQDFKMNAGYGAGYYADRACAEKCNVHINTTNSFASMDGSVFKECLFYINNSTDPLELSGTDEEQTQQLTGILAALRPDYSYANVKITTGPLFNDPEKGDLTIHPDSVLLKNKIYLDTENYIYPSAFPPALNIRCMQDSEGVAHAFDENSMSGGLVITDNGCLELLRDGDGLPVEGGRIDTKVIMLDRKFLVAGINVMLENDEVNNGVYLGDIRKTVQVRVKNSIGKMVLAWDLEDGATYLNLSSTTMMRNKETGQVRKIAVHESFVKRSEEEVDAYDSRFGLLFAPGEEGWMDCRADIDLLVKKTGDTDAGRPDTGKDGKILTNAHPEFSSEENRNRPDFYLTTKYVQYRVTVTV